MTEHEYKEAYEYRTEYRKKVYDNFRKCVDYINENICPKLLEEKDIMWSYFDEFLNKDIICKLHCGECNENFVANKIYIDGNVYYVNKCDEIPCNAKMIDNASSYLFVEFLVNWESIRDNLLNMVNWHKKLLDEFVC